MRITRGQLRKVIREETRRLCEGAVPAAGRYGQRVERMRDQLWDIGSKMAVLWDEVGDISAPDTADMLDTDFDIEAFRQQLDDLSDQLAELQVALYDVDS